MLKNIINCQLITSLVGLLFLSTTPAVAQDTDIYQANVKQNCYIALDASGSMGFGVYESNVDYGAMFDYLLTLNDSPDGDFDDYIYDTQNNTPVFYQNHNSRNRIYLVPGDIGIASRTNDGVTYIYSGDAANPEYVWHSGDMIDTYTDIASDGSLIAANPMPDGKVQRLTVNDTGYIFFDGQPLPLSQNIEYRHEQILYGGGRIQDGFGDLLNAPGYYFSGKTDGTGNLEDNYSHDYWGYRISKITEDLANASGGETIAYFFITGNWMNMQQVYNLHYVDNPGSFAAPGDAAWQFEHFPLAETDWPIGYSTLEYPDGTIEYGPNVEETRTITQLGAEQIRIHFSAFDVDGEGTNKTKDDWLIISTTGGDEVARYNNGNFPTDGWSPVIDGEAAVLTLTSDATTHGMGYYVDEYDFNPDADGYIMKDRLSIATSSILNTIEEFRGQINWGTFTFPVANGADGATSHQVINPTLNDDENRENIASDFKNVTASGGTPIGEALQEVFEVGYYQHRNSIDNLPCRKNYAIVLSDGFPSTDDNWGLINDITGDPHLPFGDWDGDGFSSDPYQPPTSPNYYDDVAHWMYTHSWLDKTEVSDPANSYVNVSSHQISFGFQNPLMQDAADEAGGIYITAYNEGQLNAAFYAIGLAMADAVSFTAPVVSVDAKNKIQNGEDLYMGLFLPLDAGYWPGNLRKFKLGDRSELRPDLWQIYDAGTSSENDANHATDRYGQFYDNTDGFWGGEDDDNDENTPDMLQIREDGVGEVLTERVEKNFDDANYYSQRNIKTLIGGNLVAFNRDNVSPLDLGLANPDTADAAVTRDKIINWIYGYTFDADATTGTPLAARDWALGAIVHSRPVVIDYLDSSDLSVVDTRYIAIGSDDGMIHIFKDTGINENDLTDHDGTEVFAFVPTEILPQLQQLEDPNLHISLVDGLIKIFRVDGQPKYLFCGLRRGGRSYIRIDISDSDPATWTVDEISSNTISELGQTWSDVILSRVRTGPASYTNVAIFSGGYDDEEDNYPEPFNDEDLNGTPYADNGNLDVGEWKSNNDEQDINGNNLYDISNPSANSMGRGIFVVDIDSTPPALLFSVKYDAASNSPALNTASNVTAQTRTDMPYCFPATPSVVSLSEINETTGLREGSILKVIYAPDIYGNMFRITYDYAEDTKLWQVKKLFSANPGSSSDSGELLQGANTDSGRKVFYGPAVSWRGTGRFFTPSNYYYSNVTFAGTLDIASLFFGTGDRVHPTYQLVRNRMYALYDDMPVSASSASGDIPVHSAPYTENNLLNITCDELGIHTTQVSGDTYTYKTALETLLRDDVTNPDNSSPMEIAAGGNGENDAKGWYIILEDQGNSTYCAHCDYAGTVDDTEGGRDYHVGEKILSKVDLFAGNIYFYSYQPAFDDPCAPEGNAFFYALNYLNGSAVLNLNDSNDLSADELEEGEDPTQKDVTDRYGKIFGVKTIGSGELVSREGEVRIISNIPGSPPLEGASTRQTPYYWIEK